MNIHNFDQVTYDSSGKITKTVISKFIKQHELFAQDYIGQPPNDVSYSQHVANIDIGKVLYNDIQNTISVLNDGISEYGIYDTHRQFVYDALEYMDVHGLGVALLDIVHVIHRHNDKINGYTDEFVTKLRKLLELGRKMVSANVYAHISIQDSLDEYTRIIRDYSPSYGKHKFLYNISNYNSEHPIRTSKNRDYTSSHGKPKFSYNSSNDNSERPIRIRKNRAPSNIKSYKNRDYTPSYGKPKSLYNRSNDNSERLSTRTRKKRNPSNIKTHKKRVHPIA